MSVRLKIFVCLLGVAIFVWGLSAYLAVEIFLGKFQKIDSSSVVESVSRARDAILRQEDILVVAAKLWSSDSQHDLQKFLQSVNLNMVAFVDASGKLSRVEWRDASSSGLTSFSPADTESLVRGVNQSQTTNAPVSGILSTSYGPMLFAAYSFDQSQAPTGPTSIPGKDVVGIVTGQLLDSSFENTLKKQLLTDVQLLPPSPKILDMFRNAGTGIVTATASSDPAEPRISGYCLLSDASDQPAVAIKVTAVRQMYNVALSSLEFFLGLTGACGIAVVVVGTLFVEFLVTRRIRLLTRSAKHADQSGMDDLPKSFTSGRDEISILARITKSTVERLSNSRLLYRAVVETQSDLIVRFQPNGNIVFANQAFARFVSRHPKAVPGTNIASYFTTENSGQDFLEECKTRFAHSRSGLLEMQFKNEKGDDVWLEWSVKSTRDEGVPDEIQIVGHDVTLRREHARSLEIARRAAEDADQAKAEFLTIMQHESRTPLSSILGISLILETTPLNKEQEEYVSLIRASGNSLLTLLNDLNDYSVISKQEFTLSNATIHVPTLIREILMIHGPSALAQGIELDSELADDAPEYIEGDGARLRQILNNLVGNGIKFTTRGFVRLGANMAAEGHIRFFVKDTGVGISEEGIQRLFKPFSTAHPENMRRRGGPGIGLAVSQKLVQQMGGKIYITSQVNLGSLFYFDLPVGHPEIPKRSPMVSVAASELDEDYSLADLEIDHRRRRDLRILVVDDNAINRKMACRLLRMIGFNAESANGGRQCVEMAGNFDLIFMDIQMPDIDGFEASRLVRQQEIESNNPRHAYIVACTAFTQFGDRERCLQAGMDNYISKPLELQAMRDIFTAYLAADLPNV